jgi:hypothetical protein
VIGTPVNVGGMTGRALAVNVILNFWKSFFYWPPKLQLYGPPYIPAELCKLSRVKKTQEEMSVRMRIWRIIFFECSVVWGNCNFRAKFSILIRYECSRVFFACGLDRQLLRSMVCTYETLDNYDLNKTENPSSPYPRALY